MKNDNEEMPTEHCRVGVQHKMTMAECAKMDAGEDEANEQETDQD